VGSTGSDPDGIVSPETVHAAQAAANELGMFFHMADCTSHPGRWEPVSRLYADAPTGPLDAMLESVRSKLSGCEARVAASILFQGYASRLLSPQLACAAIGGCVPDVSPEKVFWCHSPDQMIELGMTGGPGWQGSGEALIDRIVSRTFEWHLQALADALRRRVKLANGLLAGNVASALINGLYLLRAQLGPGWVDLGIRALAHPRLCGSGVFDRDHEAFVRRSCCLYYRVPGGGTCGDCPIGDRSQPRAGGSDHGG
jgi:iron complex transport system ATP-binding protein